MRLIGSCYKDSIASFQKDIRAKMKQYFVYIVTNKYSTVLYVGVTGDLIKRIYQHKNKLVDGFTKRYNIDKLVYYEVYEDPETAIQREKTIKNLLRKKKLELIKSKNSVYRDLYEEILSG